MFRSVLVPQWLVVDKCLSRVRNLKSGFALVARAFAPIVKTGRNRLLYLIFFFSIHRLKQRAKYSKFLGSLSLFSISLRLKYMRWIVCFLYDNYRTH
jgi:hypothetical protein